MAGGAIGMIIFVIGFLSLFNYLSQGVGERVSDMTNTDLDFTLRSLLSYVYWPVAVVMGIPPSDAHSFGFVLASKTLHSEIIGIKILSMFASEGGFSSDRTALAAAFAMGGFANMISLSAILGGGATLVGKRLRALGFAGTRGLLAATVASLLVACLVGVLFGLGGSSTAN